MWKHTFDFFNKFSREVNDTFHVYMLLNSLNIVTHRSKKRAEERRKEAEAEAERKAQKKKEREERLKIDELRKEWEFLNLAVFLNSEY